MAERQECLTLFKSRYGNARHMLWIGHRARLSTSAYLINAKSHHCTCDYHDCVFISMSYTFILLWRMIIDKLREETPAGIWNKELSWVYKSPNGFRWQKPFYMSSPSSLVMPLPVVMLVHGSLYMPILLVYDHQDGTNLGLQMRFFFLMLSCQHLDSRWDASQTWTLRCGPGSRPSPSPRSNHPQDPGGFANGPRKP